MTDKDKDGFWTGFWAWAKTPMGGAVLVGILVLFAVGIFRLQDLRGDSDAKVVSDKEAMKLYIQETARATAQEVIKASDERWTERWSNLKEDMQELKRTQRYSNLRSEAAPTGTRQNP